MSAWDPHPTPVIPGWVVVLDTPDRDKDDPPVGAVLYVRLCSDRRLAAIPYGEGLWYLCRHQLRTATPEEQAAGQLTSSEIL